MNKYISVSNDKQKGMKKLNHPPRLCNFCVELSDQTHTHGILFSQQQTGTVFSYQTK